MADFLEFLVIELRRFFIDFKPMGIFIICIISFTIYLKLSLIIETNEEIVIELKQLNTISTHRLRNQPND